MSVNYTHPDTAREAVRQFGDCLDRLERDPLNDALYKTTVTAHNAIPLFYQQLEKSLSSDHAALYKRLIAVEKIREREKPAPCSIQ